MECFPRLLLLTLAFWSGAIAYATSITRSRNAHIMGAAYFMIDDPVQTIISLEIGPDGAVGPAAHVSITGGIGQRATHVPPGLGKPASFFSPGPDPLFSQGSIVVHEKTNILVTIIPGSNEVALFNIDAENPVKLTPIGKPVNSGGEFPVSVAISSKGTMVCVLNGGKVNGVSCFRVLSGLGLVPLPNTRRLLHVNETTPPTGPLGSLSTVVFSPDDTKLLVAAKAGAQSGNGFVAAWSIAADGSLSEEAVKSFAAGPIVAFTLVNVPRSNAYVVADPLAGFVTFDYGNSTSLSATAIITNIPDQILSCWTAYSPKSGNIYIVDPVTAIITEVHYDEDLKPTIVKVINIPLNSTPIESSVIEVPANS